MVKLKGASSKERRGRLLISAESFSLDELIDYLKENAEDLRALSPGASGEFLLDIGDMALDEDEFGLLLREIQKLGLKLIGVKSYNPITKIVAANLGLKVISTSLIGGKRASGTSEQPKPDPQPVPKAVEGAKRTQIEGAEHLARHDLKKPALTSGTLPTQRGDQREEPREELSPKDRVLIITRNLRSGARIEYDGNIIVVGNVNPGAELVATGNIIVLGTLRGVAHAGANGDRNAFIYSSKFQASVVKIAGEYGPVPNPKKPKNSCLIKLEENGKITLKSIA